MHSLSEAHHSAVLRPQGQGIVSTVQKVVYDLNYTKTKAIGLLSKQKEKGFLETAKIGKSLGIPYFKTISVCFYLFRDRRHTVSTWPVQGNMSHGVASLNSYPFSVSHLISLARVAGSQET